MELKKSQSGSKATDIFSSGGWAAENSVTLPLSEPNPATQSREKHHKSLQTRGTAIELHADSRAITSGATSKGDIITATKATWSPMMNSGPLGDLGQGAYALCLRFPIWKMELVTLDLLIVFI